MGGGGHNVPFLVDRWGIRRLSVDEVALLQCVKPNELRFPAGLSDSAKLKMLGNAVCIDVVSKLFENIKTLLLETTRA
jgi:DNA (cytosine-5)-methyltransferase 1